MELYTVGAIVCSILLVLLGLIFNSGSKEEKEQERKRRADAARADALRIIKKNATTVKEWKNA